MMLLPSPFLLQGLLVLLFILQPPLAVPFLTPLLAFGPERPERPAEISLHAGGILLPPERAGELRIENRTGIIRLRLPAGCRLPERIVLAPWPERMEGLQYLSEAGDACNPLKEGLARVNFAAGGAVIEFLPPAALRLAPGGWLIIVDFWR